MQLVSLTCRTWCPVAAAQLFNPLSAYEPCSLAAVRSLQPCTGGVAEPPADIKYSPFPDLYS